MFFFATDLPGNGYFPVRFMMEVTITGAGTCKLALRVLSSNGTWGIPIDGNGNPGVLAGSTALSAGTYFFVFDNVGLFQRSCLVQYEDVGGTPITTAKIWGVVEKADL